MFVLPKRSVPTPTTIDRIGVSAKEAAEALNISERLLWKMTKDGKIPVCRIGRKLVYSVDALRNFVNNQ